MGNSFNLRHLQGAVATLESPRAERRTALVAARTKAATETCGSPRTQQTLPEQTNLTKSGCSWQLVHENSSLSWSW